MRKRILIIDKNGDIKSMLKLILSNSNKFILMGDFENFEEASRKVGKILPSVILVGDELAGVSGVEASREITETHPHTKVILLVTHESHEIIYEALKSGVSGFIQRNADIQHVIRSLDEVHRDEAPVNGKIAKLIIDYFRINPNSPLTRRETEILTMLSFGKPIYQIAAPLEISKETVKKHIHNIYGKLQVSSRSAAIEKAKLEKLI
ncbi:MAG TPA: response regulator transcription factor [Cyclobacteriaceae bacterium]